MHVLGCSLRLADPAAALSWWQRGADAGHAAARAAVAQAIKNFRSVLMGGFLISVHRALVPL